MRSRGDVGVGRVPGEGGEDLQRAPLEAVAVEGSGVDGVGGLDERAGLHETADEDLAVGLLHDMGNAQKIVAICEEIDRFESAADHVMRAAMSKLFRDEPDVRNLIKMKAIYEILETVTDRCEDVANIVEGIIVENA